MQITFKPVIYSQYKRRDGSYAVRVRVTFARKSRFITTNITVTPDQLTRGLNIRDDAVADQLSGFVRDLRRKASRLNLLALQSMDVDAVVAFLLKPDADSFSLDFPTYCRGIIERMGAGGKNYRSALNSLVAFMGRERFDVSAVTSSTMTRWQAELEARHGTGARAVSLYTSAVAYMHGRARAEYNDEEAGVLRIRNPFVRYTPPRQTPGAHRNVPPALLGLMLYWRGKLEGRERLGVDVFLLSFGLMGMNAPDLYEARKPSGGVISYNRHKTRERRADRAEMRVRIEPALEPLCAEYSGTGGRAFSFADKYGRFEDFGRAVNIGLHEFERRLGLSQPLTLYAARHTWATVARSKLCNIDKSTVNECICHVDAAMRVTDIYAEKDWAVLWDANAKVLGLFLQI